MHTEDEKLAHMDDMDNPQFAQGFDDTLYFLTNSPRPYQDALWLQGLHDDITTDYSRGALAAAETYLLEWEMIHGE